MIGRVYPGDLGEQRADPLVQGVFVMRPGIAPSGHREPLNVQKLSREQYREYSQNPTKFKERYAAGLVEYPSKK